MSPIEHVWDLAGRRLARDPRPAASKDELLLHIQVTWNSLPQADIQNMFDSMPRRIAAHAGAPKVHQTVQLRNAVVNKIDINSPLKRICDSTFYKTIQTENPTKSPSPDRAGLSALTKC
ncbi:hypothetical protein TNCV_2555031 [Trichonephila clavipes]|nr:hypothetical protein TNCV_2555031 [Trichonephila clavipes]